MFVCFILFRLVFVIPLIEKNIKMKKHIHINIKKANLKSEKKKRIIYEKKIK